MLLDGSCGRVTDLQPAELGHSDTAMPGATQCASSLEAGRCTLDVRNAGGAHFEAGPKHLDQPVAVEPAAELHLLDEGPVVLRVLSNMGMQSLESTEHSTVSICSTDLVPYVWEDLFSTHSVTRAAGRGSLGMVFASMHAAHTQVKR